MRAILFLIFFLGLPFDALGQTRQNKLPDISWQKGFFKDIDALSKKSGWPPLREVKLGHDEIELRIWEGFDGRRLRGHAIRTLRETMSAAFVEESYPPRPREILTEVSPACGWETITGAIGEFRSIELAPSNQRAGEMTGLGNTSYIVEILRGSTYRTYRYWNPEDLDRSGTKEMILAEEIRRAFNTNQEHCPGDE